MKKPALLITALLFLFVVSIYFIIPQYIKVTSNVEVDANDLNVARFLVNKAPWQKWWPGKIKTNDSVNYTFQDIDVKLHHSTYGSVMAKLKKGDLDADSKLSYNSTEEIACNVQWNAEIQSSLNPITRVKQYFAMRKLRDDMQQILVSFKKFMQTDSNIYGFKFRVEKIMTEFMLVTTTNLKEYPQSNLVYQFVDKLKLYAKQQNIKQTGVPMLNVHQTDDHAYQVMVALPVDKPVTGNKDIFVNKMVLGGNTLQTTITGGPQTVKNAFRKLKQYQKDHHLTSPAMPYELLVTDRMFQPDTAKWVTVLSSPIF
ncbi:hypothetical protein FPZ42_09640 [Mucilaginibacter achroorhodeus]|uniref:Uncharacterized protein n=1 Tax=Mucilaginibacter achroorhodeus TaxID=2599294 RepID=A0A563U7D1_9SPHI|nr:hypothetical protein [Mucilaginibacter achroorhodeus]TWR27272.1 hypothetical protein FPZ42_09640 [Mucilaginibacter achroorhodeus]